MMLETVATSTALRDVSANVSVFLLQILRVSVCSLGRTGQNCEITSKKTGYQNVTDVCCRFVLAKLTLCPQSTVVNLQIQLMEWFY